MGWYSVRCVFRLDEGRDADSAYEERVTLWRADDFDSAIELAEREALEYIEDTDWAYLGLAQCFFLGDDVDKIVPGIEVFSLIRDSDLTPEEYLDEFFDTGTEHQRHSSPPD
ncbi:DUF4288 domain-containing protein [Kribbella sp. VKM Ac-2568]|uniref:DUF4288 domain-containing protein n=1 Tax=Kribbella sp. VKM Ac-2568 TaxID=2512219 RepID=UPI00104CAE1E|nr:DUF4288 domain-containing protein [Kribbella sp. VKM Ac-2568]TCM40344.1 uncharacterized protein DUF4288 [Kribbella sp. VKM Ac-2568]